MPRKVPLLLRVETRVDRSTVYAEAERRRVWPAEMCNDLRRRHCERGWLGLSNEALRERIEDEVASLVRARSG